MGDGIPATGCWRSRDGRTLVRFLEERAVVLRRQALYGVDSIRVYRVSPLEGRRPDAGAPRARSFRLTKGAESLEITLEEDGRGGHLEGAVGEELVPIDGVPEELLLDPVPVAGSPPLDPRRMAAVREEVLRRGRTDQAVRQGGIEMTDEAARVMVRADEDNTRWLRETIAEVGWIDTERFGRSAAQAAFLLAQHSPDLRLRRAAVAPLEEEMRQDPTWAEDFALLFDRLQLDLAREQRYGTQVGRSEGGAWTVLPLEDPASVDARREAIGLPALEVYLEGLRGFYGIDRVLVPGLDDPPRDPSPRGASGEDRDPPAGG